MLIKMGGKVSRVIVYTKGEGLRKRISRNVSVRVFGDNAAVLPYGLAT